MSSQLTTLVPIMDGTNWQQWSASMQSFLMSQGQWKTTKEGAEPPKVWTETVGKDEDAVTTTYGQSEKENWLEDAEKALGNIRLRLHYTIAYQFNDVEKPSTLWEKLTEKYGAPSITNAFIEFKGAMDTQIPNGSDPSPALDKIMSHFTRLAQMGYKISGEVQLMMLISKAPSRYESIIQLYATSAMGEKAEGKKLVPEPILQGIRSAWETSTRQGTKGNNQQPKANKLSAVKPSDGQPPQFQQQQQQRGQGGRGRGTKRGKRGSGRNAQQQQQLQQAQVEAPQDFQQGPSRPLPPTPVPDSQWVPAPSNFMVGTVPPPNSYSFFASAINAGRPLPPTPPYDPSQAKWPTFGKAIDLAHRLGMPTTTETIKTLEMAEIAKEDARERSRDPRPRKRSKTDALPRGKAQGQKGKAKAKDDDVVSLDFTGDEEDRMDYDNFNSLDTEEYDVDGEIADIAGLELSCRQVTSLKMDEQEANKSLQLNSAVDSFYCNNNNCFSCSHECDRDSDKLKEWIIDSGASDHFTNDINDFIECQRVDNVSVRTANSSAQIVGQGTVLMVLSTGEIVRINPVYYIPSLTCKLLSLGVFLQNKFKCIGGKNSIRVVKGSQTFLTFNPRCEDSRIYVIRSYEVNDKDVHLVCNTIYGIDYEIMHKRLAHPSKDVLLKARKHLKDFPEIEFPQEERLCPGCAQGKMTNRSFPPSTRRATEPFQLIHSDLKSFPIDSYHKYKYIIIFLDDYTSSAWTVKLRTKDAAITATHHFIELVRNKFRSSIIQWMSDAGGEYKSKAFEKMLKDRGIEILQSIPYAHQQNGRAERIIRTLMEKAESMRLQACIPQSWWEFAVEHATHVYNRTPLRRHNWQTPYQLLYGERPSINHLRIFGCGAYVFLPAEIRANKLAPKSELMTYLGNAPGAGGFVFMRAPNNVLFYSTHCIFDETLFPKCATPTKRSLTRLLEAPPSHQQHQDDVQNKEPIPVDEEVAPPRRTTLKGKESQRGPPVQPQEEEHPEPPAQQRSEERSPDRMPPPPSPPLGPRRSQRTRRVPVRPDNVYGDRHPVEILNDPTGRKGRRTIQGSVPRPIENIPGSSRQVPDLPPAVEDPPLPPISPTESELDIEKGLDNTDHEAERACREGGVILLSFLIAKAISPIASATTNPKEWGYRDIARLPELELKEWQNACLQELEALRRRDVYELVPRPKGRKVIKNRWVFDVKTDGRKKARLVAKGFSQVEGLDYDQVFSPVVRFETVRLILAMAALENWTISGLDVRNAYLYGELDEEIYMEQPEGFRVLGREDLVIRLKKALYGLKQAGLAWWRMLRDSMKDLGFEGLMSDAGLFIFKDKRGFVIAVVYVDDALFLGPNKALVQELKQKFMRKWESRDLGDVTEFLRMKVRKESGKVHLDQCAYLETVLERCGMQNCKSATTPLPAGYMPEPVSPDTTIDPELRSRYQMVIGSLLYLMLGTRPDIAFAVTKLAQFAARPSEEHFGKALYICRYLRGSSKYQLTYDGTLGQGLVACTDSDWASDPQGRRSQTGYFLKLAGGAISWTSRAQKTVALSSTEAEYMALSDCSRQVVWMHTLMGELGYYLKPVPICGDNQGSIFIASNPVTEKRSKHIDIRFHYIRQVIDRKIAEVFFIDGDKNPADLLTKNLGSVKFLLFRPEYGLHFI